MEMNYKQNLECARAHRVDIAKLNVAFEVEDCFGNVERFEDICEAVFQMWLHTEKADLYTLTRALKDGIETQDCTLDDVLDYGESWDLVIELACQCTY